MAPGSKPARKAAASAAPRLPVKPFEKSSVFLFTPAAAYRTHYPASSGRSDFPEYPAIGARIDYYLASPTGELKLEILDPAGKVVRSYSSETRSGTAAVRPGSGRRGAVAVSTLPKKAGMNRFVWDLRHAGGPAGDGDGEGDGFGGGGPLVPPGSYKARLTADGVMKTESIVVKIDPRVAKDGVTSADLAEQTRFALKVRDLLGEARLLAAKVRTALDNKAGDRAKVQDLLSRLTTNGGPYEDRMFIDQVSNILREVNQADQKVGASAYERFNEMLKEWAVIKAAADGAVH
jgi:hypothetical protein